MSHYLLYSMSLRLTLNIGNTKKRVLALLTNTSRPYGEVVVLNFTFNGFFFFFFHFKLLCLKIPISD